MKTRYVVAIIVVCLLVAGVLGVGYYSSSVAMTGYANQLENVYQQSFYDLVNNVNDIEVNMSKALVSTSKLEQEKLFYKLYQQSNLAAANLNRLPLEHQTIKETNKFVNQLNGFSYYIFDKINAGEQISDDDYVSLTNMYEYGLYIQQIMNEFASSLKYNYNILKDINTNDSGQSSFNTAFTSLNSSTVEYPTLIYDGPFSDSVTNKTIKGLSENTVSQEVARNKVINAMYNVEYAVIEYMGKSEGKFVTYNYKVHKTNGSEVYVQVAERDGFIMQISAFEEIVNPTLSLEECQQKAETYVKDIGIQNMKAVWGTIINDVAYINLTTVVENAIIYPEMIKIKMSTQSGSILGYEAKSYAYNHINRDISEPTIEESQARKQVSKYLTITDNKLCVIPLEYNKEAFCYEYKCKLNNYVYYVYIDAKSGEQVNILRVIDTNNGQMLI